MFFLNRDHFAGISIGFLCVLSIVGSSSAWSAKYYKWVDSNGLVHYSQVPPQKDQVKSKGAISEINNASAIPVTRRGDFAYCGEMKLPGPLYEPKSILLGLGKRVDSWDKALRERERSLATQLRDLGNKNRRNNSYSSRSSSVTYNNPAAERRQKTVRSISEYRCALSWADRQKKKYSDIKKDLMHDLQGAKSNYQATLDAAHQDCGFEPKDYASPDYNRKKSAWKKCMRSHDRKIRSSGRSLKQLRGQAERLD